MPENDEIEIWVAEQVLVTSAAFGFHAVPTDLSDEGGL
jgi:hypothetical protein